MRELWFTTCHLHICDFAALWYHFYRMNLLKKTKNFTTEDINDHEVL